MLPVARVKHHIPGRARLKIASEQACRMPETASRLARLREVRAVRANPLTGSLVIEHEGSLDELAKSLEEAELLRLDLDEMREKRLREIGHTPSAKMRIALDHGVRNLNRRTMRITGGELDIPLVAAFVLGGLGIWQMTRHKVLPAGLTLLFQALAILGRMEIVEAQE